MHRTLRWGTATLVGGAVALGGAASSAQASDAGLRKVVKAQETTLAPLAKQFRVADAGLTSAADADPAAAAATALRGGLHSYRLAIAPLKATSHNGRLAKTDLMAAIREDDLGLVGYLTLIDKLKAGATKASLHATFVSLNKRLHQGAVHEARGLRLLAKTH